MPASVLNLFGLNSTTAKIIPYGNGLINKTWRVETPNGHYILQRVNEQIFTNPNNIADNIKLIAEYLKHNFKNYNFAAPLSATNGSQLVFEPHKGHFRLFPFIKNSICYAVVKSPNQAYEAAKQFAQFTKLLAGFDTHQLNITIPGFHDLTGRYQQFLDAQKNGNPQRIEAAKNYIQILVQLNSIVEEYKAIKTNPHFKLRATHHDTKISNVLFDKTGKGICVIDLDTVMPGYFISDVGDMMRTYLCPVSEEENDLSKIIVRENFYKAIVQGYCSPMKEELTEVEKKYFFYAAKFMIYMQALRFITDYFNEDKYYSITYPHQNFLRAKNQICLLQKLIEKESLLLNFTL